MGQVPLFSLDVKASFLLPQVGGVPHLPGVHHDHVNRPLIVNDVTRNLTRNRSVIITKRQKRYVNQRHLIRNINRLRFIQIPSKRLKKDTDKGIFITEM